MKRLVQYVGDSGMRSMQCVQKILLLLCISARLERFNRITYFMKVLSTPLCGVLARVAIENGKITLPAYISKVCYKGICILHGPSLTLVLAYANAIRDRDGWMLVQGLRVAKHR